MLPLPWFPECAPGRQPRHRRASSRNICSPRGQSRKLGASALLLELPSLRGLGRHAAVARVSMRPLTDDETRKVFEKLAL